jgi:hypothetical protein
MSKGYQSYDRRRTDLAFGGRLACFLRLRLMVVLGTLAFEGRFPCLLALTRGRARYAGFRRSIPMLIGFDSWSCSVCRPLNTSIKVHGRRVGC